MFDPDEPTVFEICEKEPTLTSEEITDLTKNLPVDWKAKLGTKPDRDLAAELHCMPELIARLRRAHGIKSIRATPRHYSEDFWREVFEKRDLASLPSDVLAEKLGVATRTVISKRDFFNVKKPRRRYLGGAAAAPDPTPASVPGPAAPFGFKADGVTPKKGPQGRPVGSKNGVRRSRARKTAPLTPAPVTVLPKVEAPVAAPPKVETPVTSAPVEAPVRETPRLTQLYTLMRRVAARELTPDQAARDLNFPLGSPDHVELMRLYVSTN